MMLPEDLIAARRSQERKRPSFEHSFQNRNETDIMIASVK
jgi:hypothetical protein